MSACLANLYVVCFEIVFEILKIQLNTHLTGGGGMGNPCFHPP